jgi:hypothetical protein
LNRLKRRDLPADLLDPLLMPMDSPAADFPVVNLPLTSSVYFKNGNPVRTTDAPLEGLVRVTEGDDGKFIGMGEMDGEGRVAPRRLVVEYPVETAITAHLAISRETSRISPLNACKLFNNLRAYMGLLN